MIIIIIISSSSSFISSNRHDEPDPVGHRRQGSTDVLFIRAGQIHRKDTWTVIYTYIYIYIYIYVCTHICIQYISLSLSLSLYIYIYMYIYVYTYMYIHIYIYIERERDRSISDLKTSCFDKTAVSSRAVINSGLSERLVVKSFMCICVELSCPTNARTRNATTRRASQRVSEAFPRTGYVACSLKHGEAPRENHVARI